ncbi:putative cysteine desulfurase [Novipirellula aureliae]|uniref:cysteine desulfurase n=1 Tax=Novipirellula aureliae TaxID=2527966 RepID=A0A5C6DK34_9BACT|nr:aminotransferase class V-fold PLP-dependent enzyme [Novipirellula aureliae]TWU37693.1 putative cysteine desulfurase [Novipirellula aureliae]
MRSPRIYLDHAATSWPKPESVFAATDLYHRHVGAAAGRGQYASASKADHVVAAVRRHVASLISAESSDCIALFSNGTMALNAAIAGILCEGDHVITTAAEHNSVLRPLSHLNALGRISLTIVDCDRYGLVDAAAVAEHLRDTTKLVAVTAASNVTGTLQPIEKIGQYLAKSQAAFLVDAAQTFGYLPINVEAIGVDLLAAPGHKGGNGPQGTGFLYVAPEWHPRIAPSTFGGTGTQSESLEMPTTMPAKLEAGNLNVAALAGWAAGLKELIEIGQALHTQHCKALANHLHEGIRAIGSYELFGQGDDLPIASIRAAHFTPSDLAVILDAEFGIETRAGLHCAALIHSHLGSSPDGTLRISGGAATTPEEIDRLLAALRTVAAEF